MNKTVILGAQGLLGQELAKTFFEDTKNYEVITWDIADLDVTNFSLLAEKLALTSPSIVINAVAYNGVDESEEGAEEWARAVTLNAELPKQLAKLSRELDFTLVHYSTDYVFDGTLEAPVQKKCQGACCGGNCHGSKAGYDEAAMPNPMSKYAETKLAGERALPNGTDTYYLIRLSKLFGKPASSVLGKRSFFAVMLELSKTQSEVSVVDGEMSCFTYAPDLAKATKELLESGDAFGIYHLVNEGPVTWYEGVLELYRQAGISTAVKAVAPESYARKALRPAFSVLVNTKRPKLRHYSEALSDFLKSV